VREALELRRKLPVLLLDVELLDGLRYQRLETIQLVGGEWLLDVVVCALAHCLHGGIDGRLTSHDDALGGDGAKLQLFEESKAVHLRHLEIGENDAEALGGQLVQCLLTVNRNSNLVAFITEYGTEPFRDRAVVVRDQDSGGWFLSFRNGFYPRARLLI
jgi:hypothetical protein